MTIKQWLKTVFVCLSIFIASRYFPAPDGANWFVAQGLWSTLAAVLVLSISTSKPAILIASIEFSAVIINFIACAQYLGSGGIFYAYCVEANSIINLTEVVILITGAPRDGLVNRLKSMGLDYFLYDTNNHRSLEDSFSNQGKSRWNKRQNN